MTPELRQKCIDSNIINTAEFFDLGTIGAQKINEALADDGKVSVWEGGAMSVALLKPAKLAFEDAAKVLSELDNAGAVEVGLIGEVIWPYVGTLTEFHQEAVRRSVTWLQGTAHLVYFLRHKQNWSAPPSAKAVDGDAIPESFHQSIAELKTGVATDFEVGYTGATA